jgi:hypothetical protein
MEPTLAIPAHPYLSRLLDRAEAWTLLGDFDGMMKAHDERVRSTDSSTDAATAAILLHDFARDHYHLLLVGQYKIKEIGRGIHAALDSQNETVLLNLTRALVEHTAALAYQLGALEKAVQELPKKPDPKSLRATITRHYKMAKRHAAVEGPLHARAGDRDRRLRAERRLLAVSALHSRHSCPRWPVREERTLHCRTRSTLRSLIPSRSPRAKEIAASRGADHQGSAVTMAAAQP